MVRVGPVVAFARAAPVADQIARLIELEHGRRGRAALRDRRRIGVACTSPGFERAGAMNDPDVILRIDRYADRLAEDPMIGQRLRPQRVHFESRRLSPAASTAAFLSRITDPIPSATMIATSSHADRQIALACCSPSTVQASIHQEGGESKRSPIRFSTDRPVHIGCGLMLGRSAVQREVSCRIFFDFWLHFWS